MNDLVSDYQRYQEATADDEGDFQDDEQPVGENRTSDSTILLEDPSLFTHRRFRSTRPLTRNPANTDCSMDHSRKVAGEVKEVDTDVRAAKFEWRTPDFFQLLRGCNLSPSMKYFNIKWRLEMYKSGNVIYRVSLRRALLTPGIHFTITCKTSDGEERDVAREETHQEGSRWWRRQISPWRIPPSAGVILTCSLWKCGSPHAPGVSRETQTEDARDGNDEHPLEGVSRETQTEDAQGRNDEEDTSRLSDHMKNLLLSGDGHDVLLKVREKQFRAHKNILKVRSPVFAAMLGNEMAESVEGSVTIQDCDPDAFGEFLQFVYSGKADIASVSRALGLYYAGDKYDFPRLKETCVEFLKNSFTTTTVFHVITLAARHDEEELLQQAIVYLSSHLEEVMRTVEWQRFLTANPIEANEMCLKAFECKRR